MCEANEPPSYAGFWRRLAAALIDAVVLATAGFIMTFVSWRINPGMISLISGDCDTPARYIFEVCAGISAMCFGVESITVLSPLFFVGFERWVMLDANPQVNPLQAWVFVLAFPTVNWLYHALLESSTKQATVGKMLLKIRVTDLRGGRITFWRATGRHFSKVLSILPFCIGYLVVGWTKKKQGLHDKLSNCLLVRNLRDSK
jgi:uncharacterized RDD family membrane protein YckC